LLVPSPKLEPVVLSEEERQVLLAWSRRRKTAQALAVRSRIVLRCAEGGTIGAVAADGGVSRGMVSKWRWAMSYVGWLIRVVNRWWISLRVNEIHPLVAGWGIRSVEATNCKEGVGEHRQDRPAVPHRPATGVEGTSDHGCRQCWFRRERGVGGFRPRRTGRDRRSMISGDTGPEQTVSEQALQFLNLAGHRRLLISQFDGRAREAPEARDGQIAAQQPGVHAIDVSNSRYRKQSLDSIAISRDHEVMPRDATAAEARAARASARTRGDSHGLVVLLVVTLLAFSNYAAMLSVVPLWMAHGGAASGAVGGTTGVMMAATVATQLAMPWLFRLLTLRAMTILGAVMLGAPTPLYLLSAGTVPVMALTVVRGAGFVLVVMAGTTMVTAIARSGRLATSASLYGTAAALPNVAALAGGVWLARTWGYDLVFWGAGLASLAAGLVAIALPAVRGRFARASWPRLRTLSRRSVSFC
jgi:hypothetical protein